MRRILLLSTALLSSVFLFGCSFCLYQHSAQLVPTYQGLEPAIETAYAGYFSGIHTDAATGTFIPITGIPAVDILKTILAVEGAVQSAESISNTVLDNTATSEVLKSKFIPFEIHEEKRWFVFSTGK